jgi:hypothetical protein
MQAAIARREGSPSAAFVPLGEIAYAKRMKTEPIDTLFFLRKPNAIQRPELNETSVIHPTGIKQPLN